MTVDQTETVNENRLCHLGAQAHQKGVEGYLDISLVFEVEVFYLIGIFEENLVVTDRFGLHVLVNNC